MSRDAGEQQTIRRREHPPSADVPKVRLFVEVPLAQSSPDILVSGVRAHYLIDVMRMHVDDSIRLFNGTEGEWVARLVDVGRRSCSLRLERHVAAQASEPGPWLVFALLKRPRLDLTIEKATELGVERLLPVITRRTVTAPPNAARLRAIAIEAAEQCGRLTLPQVEAPVNLAQLVRDWPPARPLLLMTPAACGIPIADVCRHQPPLGPGVLIGPEGGFEATELDELLTLPFVVPVSLGRLVLRAETAAIAALACIQAFAGTWTEAAGEGAE
jgi:16S rRNA (uracil1498-N3)-methyltransferase